MTDEMLALASAAEVNDRLRCPCQLGSHSLGIRCRFGRNEIDCCTPGLGMITSTIHVLILVPVFFALMKERALRRGTLVVSEEAASKWSVPE
jgi:hypothetical protein